MLRSRNLYRKTLIFHCGCSSATLLHARIRRSAESTFSTRVRLFLLVAGNQIARYHYPALDEWDAAQSLITITVTSLHFSRVVEGSERAPLSHGIVENSAPLILKNILHRKNIVHASRLS